MPSLWLWPCSHLQLPIMHGSHVRLSMVHHAIERVTGIHACPACMQQLWGAVQRQPEQALQLRVCALQRRGERGCHAQSQNEQQVAVAYHARSTTQPPPQQASMHLRHSQALQQA